MATFHARFHEDFFSISRLIVSRANDLGLTRRQVVERLGFGDRLAKGHTVLSETLLTGVVPPYVNSSTMADALEVDQSFLAEVLSATVRQQDAEQKADLVVREEIYRAQFRPHLQAKTERKIPSPIFVAAFLTTERLRILYLPEDINALDEDQRNQIVGEMIQKHYRRTSGHVPAFGRIEGYYFVQFPGFGRDDFGVPFNVDGSRSGAMVAIQRVPEAGLGLKRGDNRLTGLLKNEPIQEILYGEIDITDLRESECLNRRLGMNDDPNTPPPLLHLDIDGVLLRRRQPGLFDAFELAPDCLEFLEWATTQFRCRWLSTRCRAGWPDGSRRAFQHAGARLDELRWTAVFKLIEPARWSAHKTEALDANSNFWWVDDNPTEYDRGWLRDHGRQDRLIEISSDRYPRALNSAKSRLTMALISGLGLS